MINVYYENLKIDKVNETAEWHKCIKDEKISAAEDN